MSDKAPQTPVHKELCVGRYAAIGQEGVLSLVGQIVDVHGGVLTLQVYDYSEGSLTEYFVEYDLAEVCDYEFALSTASIFHGPDGKLMHFDTYLKMFADDWNRTGFYR